MPPHRPHLQPIRVAALITGPALVAAGFAVLFLGGSQLSVVLSGVALWGIGIAATVVIYQQAILLTGRRAPETATSIGVLLAQTGFAAGSTVGGATITVLGVAAIPLVALAFVIGSLVIATTLRPLIRASNQEDASDEVGRMGTPSEVAKAMASHVIGGADPNGPATRWVSGHREGVRWRTAGCGRSRSPWCGSVDVVVLEG